MLYVEPQSAQNVQEQDQPSNQYASPNPSVEELQKKSNQGTDKKEKNKAEKDGLIRKFFQFVREYNAEIVAISTVVMAIFTIALSASTYLLWKSGEKHSERELRAYVGIDSADFLESVKYGTTKAEMWVKNTGQTPAYDVLVSASFYYCSLPLEHFPDHKPERESKVTLFPNCKMKVPAIMEAMVGDENRKAIKADQAAFFFYGKIRYRDAFGNDWYTNFRYIADDKSGTLQWRGAKEGNDAS
jgi:hypothetical protein